MQRLEWHCHAKSVSGALYKAILYHGQSAGKEMANYPHENMPELSCKSCIVFVQYAIYRPIHYGNKPIFVFVVHFRPIEPYIICVHSGE